MWEQMTDERAKPSGKRIQQQNNISAAPFARQDNDFAYQQAMPVKKQQAVSQIHFGDFSTDYTSNAMAANKVSANQ